MANLSSPWEVYEKAKPVTMTFLDPIFGPSIPVELIHAAKTFDDEGWKWIQCNSIRLEVDQELYEFIETAPDWPRGAIIGQVEMIDCVTHHSSPWFFGPWGHLYENPVQFKKPVPLRGMPGIFDVPDMVLKGTR
jgi:hypothetical protein